ncbi:MAG: protein kinase [Cyanobacteria bacterium SZAS-4]|nr:protein kinase [Cyanobacteria bacterium SZAS-4]
MDDQFQQTHSTELADDSNKSSVAVDFNAGSIIMDKYLVINLLGRGGMGSVYQVRDLQLRTEFALKCLNNQHTNDVAWRRFDNEARAANKLDHPNLIKVHDSGLLPDDRPYFVMDLVRGVSLADVLKEKTRLPLQKTLKIMIQVAFAVAYAHDRGVIHRDIKPSNIMIGNDSEIADGNVKLVDFGIAKLTGLDTFNQLTLTRTGEIFGSPLYMSPEQCAGIATDHRSDLYSFGCVMYECLTGAPPILADNALSTMIKHQNERPVSLKQASLGMTFPDASELIVAKLLEKNPDERYQNAHELSTDLVALEQHLVSGASEPSVVLKNTSTQTLLKPEKASFSRTQISAPLAVLLLVTMFMGGFFTGRLSVISEKDDLAIEPKVQLKKEDTFAVPTGRPNPIDISPSNHRPWSASGGLTREFTFPDTSLGDIKFPNGQYQEAKDYFVYREFVPLNFTTSNFLCKNPHLITRFRSDELEQVNILNSDVNLKKILTGLLSQKSLINLNLANSPVDDSCLKIIGEMPNLLALNLSGSQLTGASISKLKNFEHIEEFNCTQIADPKPLIAAFKRMHKLRILDFSRANVDESDILAISKIKTITRLDVTGEKAVNDKTIVYLSTLPALNYLDIENCPVTAKSIPAFQKMRLLHTLHMTATRWTEKQKRDLEHAMSPNCKVMYTSGNPELEKLGDELVNDAPKYADKLGGSHLGQP